MAVTGGYARRGLGDQRRTRRRREHPHGAHRRAGAVAGRPHGRERHRRDRRPGGPAVRGGAARRGEREAAGPGRGRRNRLARRPGPEPVRGHLLHGDEDRLAPDGRVSERRDTTTDPTKGLNPFSQIVRFIGRSGKRIAVAVVGLAVLIAGIVMMVTPGPGVLVIVLGLAILASEWAWAERALDRAKAGGKVVLEQASAPAPRSRSAAMPDWYDSADAALHGAGDRPGLDQARRG